MTFALDDLRRVAAYGPVTRVVVAETKGSAAARGFDSTNEMAVENSGAAGKANADRHASQRVRPECCNVILAFSA